MKTKGKTDTKRASDALQALRELAEKFGGPTKGMTEDEVLRSIKKTREALWDQRLASRT